MIDFEHDHEATEEEITQAYKDMVKTSYGRIIVHDLKDSFYDIHTYSPNEGADRDRALFLEGCRWVVGYILSQVNQKDPAPGQDNHSKGLYL